MNNAAAGRALVLVVDDSPVVRMYYRQILEEAGFGVAEAVNGMEALELILRVNIALCLVDLNMPVMDGYAFLRALRQTDGVCDLPVVMISVASGAADRRRALVAGANAYLVKPVARPLLRCYAMAMMGLVA